MTDVFIKKIKVPKGTKLVDYFAKDSVGLLVFVKNGKRKTKRKG